MSTLLRSPCRLGGLLAWCAARLLVAAILIQPASVVVRAAVPAESAEAQESEPAGESETVESELTATTGSLPPRFSRRTVRRAALATAGAIDSTSPASGPRRPGAGVAAGHRLPNGHTAPLRC